MFIVELVMLEVIGNLADFDRKCAVHYCVACTERGVHELSISYWYVPASRHD